MNRVKIRIPNYYEQFSCIGSSCPNTCCKYWNIAIEKEKYLDYQDSKKYPLLNLKSITEQVPKNQTYNNFGFMKLIKGRCSLLDEHNLCKLQAEYGHDSLPLVCKLYPRQYTSFNNVIHLSCFLSCPEITRIAMDSEVDLTYKYIYSDDPYLVSLHLENIKSLDSEKRLINEKTIILKNSILDILNSQYYNTPEKIMIIGMLIDRVEKYMNNHQQFIKSINGFMSDYIKPELKGYLKSAPINLNLQFDLLLELFKIKIQLPSKTKIYTQFIKDFSFGLGLSNGNDYDTLKSKFLISTEKYKKELSIEIDSMLLKYLTISFDTDFKYNSTYKAFSASYFQIISIYALMEFMLIGINQSADLTQSKIIEFIYSYTRYVQHSYTFKNDITDFLYDNKKNSLAYISILTKR